MSQSHPIDGEMCLYTMKQIGLLIDLPTESQWEAYRQPWFLNSSGNRFGKGGFPAKVLALHHTSANNRWDRGWTFRRHDFPNKSGPCTPFHIQTNIPIALLILFCIPVPMAGVDKSKITNMPHICKAGFVVGHNLTFLYMFSSYIYIYIY